MGSMVDTVSKKLQLAQGVAQCGSGRDGGARVELAWIRAGPQRQPSKPIVTLEDCEDAIGPLNGLAHRTAILGEARAWQNPLCGNGRRKKFAPASWR